MTQPTGTSPRAPAARASSSALAMKEVMVPCEPLCYQPSSTSRTMNANTDQHKPGERIAKAIARAGLASRREAEACTAAGARAHAAFPLSQAARADDDPRRSAGPADHLRTSSGGAAAPDQRRPARFQYRGTVAP